uniref:Uncharacterized protein n=1 Tax=Romanomermis culicivorax TaxID=13658 RepID=A0A915JWD7_ROMCU
MNLETVLPSRLLQRPCDQHSKTRSVPQTPVSYPKFRRRRPDTLNLTVADHLICGSCLRNPAVLDRSTVKTAVGFNSKENDSIQPSTSVSSSPIFRGDGQKLKILLKNSPCPDCNTLKRNFSSTTPVESSTSKNESFVQSSIDQLDMILPACKFDM